ncbi:MAG: ATP-binding protein [Pseudomonadota bacterium]
MHGPASIPFQLSALGFYRLVSLFGFALLAITSLAYAAFGIDTTILNDRTVNAGFALTYLVATYVVPAIRKRPDLGMVALVIALAATEAYALQQQGLAPRTVVAAIITLILGSLILFTVAQVITAVSASTVLLLVATLRAGAPTETIVANALMWVFVGAAMILAVSGSLTVRNREREREGVRRVLFQESSDGIIYGDARKLEAYDANDAAFRLLGTNDPQIASNILRDAFLKANPGDPVDALRELLRAGYWRGEVEAVRPDGSTRWLELTFQNIDEKADGVIVSKIVDIQEAKERQRALQESEILLQRTQAMSGVAGWMFDLKAETLTLSDSALVQLDGTGLKSAERSVEEQLAFSSELSPELGKAMRAAIESQTPYRLVVPIPTEDGNTKMVESVGEALVEDGKTVALIGCMRDITEQLAREEELRRAKEQAESAALARTQFLANMSHEIRTPLNGMLGMASLLSESDLSEDAAKMVDTINGSGESLLRIINDILDFSKIDAGQLSVESTAFDPIALAKELALLYRPLMKEKGLAFNVRYAALEGEQHQVIGDPTRVKQVLNNLLSNAAKFTKDGSVALTVTVSAPVNYTVYPQLRVQFEVRDTGIGIPGDAIERLFKPFVQADDSITRRFGGTGLGLSISRSLAELMGGNLSVDSTPGQGSHFQLELTLPVAAAPKQAAEESTTLLDALHGLRVLIVEDNPVNQQVAQKMLKRLGIDGELADDGEVGVERLSAEFFDIVFMDMQMPQLDGIEATRQIRALTDRPQPYIIAMTANALVSDRDRCFEAGMNDFVPKPVRLDDLRAVLSRATATLDHQRAS